MMFLSMAQSEPGPSDCTLGLHSARARSSGRLRQARLIVAAETAMSFFFFFFLQRYDRV
jgi:hypothetical protein